MGVINAKNHEEWLSIQKRIPLSELGGQALVSVLGDKAATQELQFQTRLDVERIHKLKEEINQKLPEDASIQDYLDVLTKNTPIVCVDMKKSRLWRLLRKLKAWFGFSHPRYRWLLASNMASTALCHHARKALLAERESINDLTVCIIPLELPAVNRATIMEANLNFRNLFLFRGDEA